jgi:hypothetical protein
MTVERRDDRNRRPELARELRRYRARVMLVAAVRHGALAMLLAIGAAAAMMLLWTPNARTAVAVVAALVLLAVIVAAVAARILAPSLAQTATLVDRRLGSNDCLVTAVECLGASDPVADLVVREAVRRLARVTPATLLPFELPRRFAPAAATVGAIAIAAVLVPNRSQEPATSAASAGRATPSAERSTASARGQRGRTANPQDASVADAATRAIPSVPDRTVDRSRITTSDNAAGRSGSEAGRPTAPGGSRSTATDTPRAASDGTTTPNQPDRGSTANQSSDPGSTNASARGGRSNGAASQSGTAGAIGAGGGRSTALASRTASGAGGVSGGSLSNTATGRSDAPRVGQSAAITSEAAWTRAQAAIARDRIPSDLRQVVQDYFTAIRRAPR